MADKNFTPAELYEAWPVLSMEERVEGFEFLPREEADDFFLQLSARDRAQLVLALPPGERRLWVKFFAPGGAPWLVLEGPAEERGELVAFVGGTYPKEKKRVCRHAAG